MDYLMHLHMHAYGRYAWGYQFYRQAPNGVVMCMATNSILALCSSFVMLR